MLLDGSSESFNFELVASSITYFLQKGLLKLNILFGLHHGSHASKRGGNETNRKVVLVRSP